MNIFKKIDDTIKIKDSMKVRSESGYLISSNKEKCARIISESDINTNDIIDCLVSLHIILEVSLNTFYRHIALASLKKDINEFEVMENVDRINFIDKTILFIYNANFDFKEELIKAAEYHKIINTLKDFSELRNKLLHGHSISTIFDGEKNLDSKLKSKINLSCLSEQIKKFRFILEGMRFYLNHLDVRGDIINKEFLKDNYLSDDFLPHASLSSD